MFWSDQNLALRGKNIPLVSITVKYEIQMKTIKNRNRNGRPVKGLSEKKAYKVTVKMATEEFYTLKAKAKFAGINRMRIYSSVYSFQRGTTAAYARTDEAHSSALWYGKQCKSDCSHSKCCWVILMYTYDALK